MHASADLTTKLILGLSAVMTVMIAVVIYTVVFRYDDPWASVPDGNGVNAPGAVKISCDASDIASMECPPGFYCHFDTCELVEPEKVCEKDEGCRDCECKEGLVCHQFRCVDRESVDPAPLECTKDEKLAQAVKALAVKCQSRRKGVDELVSAGACSDQDWQQLALEDDRFDLLLAAFPNRFAVLFPSGRPYLKREDWPNAAEREHFLEQLRRFNEPLATAKQIFVIGRSSPDGNPETNRLLALRRMKMVANMIDQIVNEGVAATDTKSPKFRSFALASKKPILPFHFRKSYLGASSESEVLETERLILADEKTHAKIAAALGGGLDLQDQQTRAWRELFDAINRVVLVIPIPCTGDEYEPPKTVLTPDPP